MGRWVGGEWDGLIASRLAPTFGMQSPVGASLLAKNDNAVSLDSHRQPIQHVPLETGT
ncbi:hypothetical protein D3C87_1058730 [compost metagenome]